MGEEDVQPAPLLQRVAEGFAHVTLREVAAAGLKPAEGFAEPFNDRSALGGAHGDPQLGASAAIAQPGLDAVEVLDLP